MLFDGLGQRCKCYIIVAITCGVCFLFSIPTLADDKVNLIKAGIILKISNFIQWPKDAEACQKVSEELVIYVQGKSPLYDPLLDLQKLNSRGKQKVIIKKYTDTSNVGACALLVLSSGDKNRIPELLKLASTNNLVTISDTKGFGKAGVLINLYVVKNKVRFEVNTRTLESSSVGLSYKLLKAARKVK